MKWFQLLFSSKGTVERPLFKAAVISLLMAVIKLAAFLFTGSLLALASFFDSLTDAIISLINRFVHKLAKTAPDTQHPFGHGGMEVLSSLVQVFTITVTSALLFFESMRRIFYYESIEYFHYDNLPLGAAVLFFSALGSFYIQRFLDDHVKKLTAEEKRSLALMADQAHYAGDAKNNLLSASGMVIVWFVNIPILDAFFGMAGALYLFKAIIPVFKQLLQDILQSEANPGVQQKVVNIAMSVDSKIIGVHRLRSRQSGPLLFVDFHLKLPALLSLEVAHGIGEKVSRAIKATIPNSDVIIHLDPDSEPDDDQWQPSYKL